PVPAQPLHSAGLPVDARRDPARLAAAGPGRWRAAEPDEFLCRSRLHGSRVPAARNQEHRPVRAAVRHHLVRKLPGLRRGPARGLSGRRDRALGELPPPVVLYTALLASLVLTWFVPQDSLLGLPVVPRFLAASALAFAPIYIANLVFAQRFKGVETSST